MSRVLVGVLFLCVLTYVPGLAIRGYAASGSEAVINAVAVPPQQVDSTCSQPSAIGLNLSYSGAKPLRAYAISVQFRDGAQPSKVSLYSGETIHDKDTWHVTVCGVSSNTDLTTVRTQTDMMSFVDGTYTGPVRLRQSQHLVGTLEATDYTRGASPALAQVFARPASSTERGNLIPIDDSSLPISIDVSTSQASSKSPLLVVGARNTGTVPILGLEFKTSYFDHVTGKFEHSVTTKAVCVVNDKLVALAPDARWQIGGRKIPVSADGAQDNYVVTVDAVYLVDGTFLGARKSREAEELRGIIEGLQTAQAQRGGS